MQQLTVDFSDETLASLDAYAELVHDGDREEAAQALLEDWIAER